MIKNLLAVTFCSLLNAQSYGNGCSVPSTNPVTVISSTSARIANPIFILYTDVASLRGPEGSAVVFLGSEPRSIQICNGCYQLTSADLFAIPHIFPLNGINKVVILPTIPNDPCLIGQRLYIQSMIMMKFSGSLVGFTATNGIALTIED